MHNISGDHYLIRAFTVGVRLTYVMLIELPFLLTRDRTTQLVKMNLICL